MAAATEDRRTALTLGARAVSVCLAFALLGAAVAGAACTAIGGEYVQRVTLSATGCNAEGDCPYSTLANYWYQPTHEIVIASDQDPDYNLMVLFHEACHAWEGRRCADDDIDLVCWLDSPEALAFPTTPSPWPGLYDTTLEDAAETCAEWQLDADGLKALSPERYEWAQTWLPAPTRIGGD